MSDGRDRSLVKVDLNALQHDIRSFIHACDHARQDEANHSLYEKAREWLERIRIRLCDGDWKRLDVPPKDFAAVRQVVKWVELCWKSEFENRTWFSEITDEPLAAWFVNTVGVARDFGVNAFVGWTDSDGSESQDLLDETAKSELGSANDLQDEMTEGGSRESPDDDAKLTTTTASPHSVDSLDLSALAFLASRTLEAMQRFHQAIEAASYKTALSVYPDVFMLLSKCQLFVRRFKLDAPCLVSTKFDAGIVVNFVRISREMLDHTNADQIAWHRSTCPDSDFNFSRWQSERDQWWRDNVPDFNPECTVAHCVRKSDVLDFESCVMRIEQVAAEVRNTSWTMDALNQLIAAREISITATIPPQSTLHVPLAGKGGEQIRKHTRPTSADGIREPNGVIQKVADDLNQKVS